MFWNPCSRPRRFIFQLFIPTTNESAYFVDGMTFRKLKFKVEIGVSKVHLTTDLEAPDKE